MTISSILVLIGISAVLGLPFWKHWRILLLLAASELTIFALQPALPVRNLDFWLPTATLVLTVIAWVLTTPQQQRQWREQIPAAAILAGIVLLLGLTRYLDFSLPLTASPPPQLWQIGLVVVMIILLAALLMRFAAPNNLTLTIFFLFIVALFILLKVPALVTQTGLFLRSLNQQSVLLASPLDVRWLGFSYIAFRILHTVRDRQSGRLPAVSLAEYIIYVIFFPALSAGPIDRIERFLADLRRPPALTASDYGQAGQRLVLGLFKKFVVADGLGLMALNGTNALQVQGAGWAWVLLYAYTLQIYFDFSGYTDIAIGMGSLMGIKLPENFNAPYLKPTLTQFWNSWHITLTQWFRSYFFNPLTRALRASRWAWPPAIIILATQLATMLLIGLWHGATWPFIAWGIWHGLGLFVDNRLSGWSRSRLDTISPRWQTAWNLGGVFVTFHFVALGWVFFALPSLSVCLHFFRVLFSLG
jgi:D-alanyl-lipoteichoic acid acyltransferase DltB (MBOAT superfamily)